MIGNAEFLPQILQAGSGVRGVIEQCLTVGNLVTPGIFILETVRPFLQHLCQFRLFPAILQMQRMIVKIVVRAGDQFFQHRLAIRREGEFFQETSLLRRQKSRRKEDEHRNKQAGIHIGRV